MKINKKIGLSFVGLGIVFISIAVVFYVHNYMEDRNAGIISEYIVTKLINEKADHNKLDTEMTVKNIDGNDYIGYITIPSIDICLPVMSDWNYEKLKIAPCRYNGWTTTGDFVIAAHNYKKHFGLLSELKNGDKITFTDLNGNVYCYEVGDMEILPPEATEEMIKSDWDLSLYTCVYSGSKRITIRCKKVDMYHNW